MENQLTLNILLFIVMFIVGLCFIILPPIIEDRRSFGYGIIVHAQVYNRKNICRNGVNHTYLVWRYKYNGKDHFYHSRRSRNDEKRNIGDWGAVAINKKNPAKVYEFMTYKEKIILRILGISFIGISLACIVMTVI